MATITSKFEDRPFSDLVDDILPHVVSEEEDMPTEVIELAIRTASQDFIKRSQMLRTWINIDAQAGVDEYPLELSDCYRVNSVHKVTVGDCEYGPIHEDQDNGRIRNVFYRTDNNWLVVRPAPCEDADMHIRAYVSIYPTRDACGIPIDIYEEHGTAIVDGALSDLLSMRDYLWYNQRESERREAKYKAAINNARVRGIKGGVRGNHRGLRPTRNNGVRLTMGRHNRGRW